MRRIFYRLHASLFTRRHMWSEELLALVLVMLVFISPVAASTRFEQRGLFMQSTRPGVTTNYTVSLRYMTPQPVGSLDMLFCIDPIPHHPCVPPPGLDVSGVTLASQSGETGFTIDPGTHTDNHILLTRDPSMIMSGDVSSYTFEGVVNPTDISESFSIRLRSHASTDGSGPLIDFGSVKGQITNDIVIETQVPPMLIFCLAHTVALGCTETDDTYYSDMGQLSEHDTLTAQSQMAVGTNATAGFVITVNGAPPAAGTSVIDAATTPSFSQQGTNQFGINLVANNAPTVGVDPEGTWANAMPSADYGTPNMYKFVPGDVVAYSPNVSLMKKFTVSYILNSSPDLRAGVYTTTLTFIASGRF